MTLAMGHINLEICVDTPFGLHAAIQNGADRIELCSALDLGGLTPSHGFMKQASKYNTDIIAMIRPRAGGFVYNEKELEQMAHDIVRARKFGLKGVIFGCLHENGALNTTAMAGLIKLARGMEVVIHRAFDHTPDLEQSLEQLVSLKVNRVLTAGGPSSALDGAAKLAKLKKQAAGRIEILGCGGVRANNIADIHAHTALNQYHAGPRIPFARSSAPQSDTYNETDPDEVCKIRKALNDLSPPELQKNQLESTA